MTELIKNRNTDTRHIVDTGIDREEWQADVAHCGETGHALEATNGWAAKEAADNLCETCRRNADKETLMPLYERASEYEAKA